MKKIFQTLFIFFLIFSVTGCSSRKVAMIEKQFAEEIESFQSQLTEAEKQVQNLSDENISLQKEIEAKEITFNKTMKQLNDLTDEHLTLQSTYEENNAKLSETTEQLDNIMSEKNKIAAELEETTEKLNNMTEELSSLQKQAEEKDQALSESDTAIDSLNRKNNTLQTELDKALNEVSELTAANTSLQNTIEEKELELTAIAATLDNRNSENETLQTQIEDNLHTINEHAISNTTLQNSLSEKDNELAKKDMIINTLSSEKEGLQIQLDESLTKLNELTISNTSLQGKMSEIEQALTEAAESIDTLTDEKETLQVQLDEKTTSINELSNSNTVLQETITEKEQALAEAAAAIDNLKSENETLHTQLNDIITTDDVPKSSSSHSEVQTTEINQTQTITNDDPLINSTKANISLLNPDEPISENLDKEPESEKETASTNDKNYIEQEIIEIKTKTLNGIDMVYVPEGEFIAESGSKEATYIDNYWITRTEITNAQYKKCVDAGTCSATDLMDLENIIFANYPATYVTYRQAQRYCSWLGGSLPDESQWEKAARGNNSRIYPWGDETPSTENLFANIPGLTYDLAPVGSFPNGISPYGALDMAGNAWEWTSGIFTPECTDHVIRGGSAAPAEEENFFEYLQTSYRGHAATPNYYIGFRCVIPDGTE